MNLPCIVTLCLLVFAFFRPGNLLLNVAFFLLAFGAMAIVPAEMLGGLTILSSAVAFILVFLKVALRGNGVDKLIKASLDPRGMGILALYTVIAIVGALALPRIFAGSIMVFPMSGSMTIVPVYPTGSNINQAADLLISFSVATAFFVLAKSEDFHTRFTNALLWAGGAVVITGVADFISPYVGLSVVLAEFRTASYAFLTDNVVLGVRRIIGLMTEASSYGTLAATIGGFLLFTRNAFPKSLRLRAALPLAITCLVFAALSTSSSAYLALACVGALFVADYGYRLSFGTKKQKTGALKGLIVFSFIGLIGLCIMAALPQVRDPIVNMVDATIFKKSQSTSFMERSMWNTSAWDAFKDSSGVGIGVGSARTSNFFINVLASTGILGGLLFGAFLFQVFFAKLDKAQSDAFELVHGAKLSLLIGFVGLALSGTTPDYGVYSGSVMGMIIGISYAQRKRRLDAAMAVPIRPVNPRHKAYVEDATKVVPLGDLDAWPRIATTEDGGFAFLDDVTPDSEPPSKKKTTRSRVTGKATDASAKLVPVEPRRRKSQSAPNLNADVVVVKSRVKAGVYKKPSAGAKKKKSAPVTTTTKAAKPRAKPSKAKSALKSV